MSTEQYYAAKSHIIHNMLALDPLSDGKFIKERTTRRQAQMERMGIAERCEALEKAQRRARCTFVDDVVDNKQEQVFNKAMAIAMIVVGAIGALLLTATVIAQIIR